MDENCIQKRRSVILNGILRTIDDIMHHIIKLESKCSLFSNLSTYFFYILKASILMLIYVKAVLGHFINGSQSKRGACLSKCDICAQLLRILL